jgi:TPR repeat protein
MKKYLCFLGFAFGFFLFVSSASADLARGVEAYKSGEFESALAELRPLAEEGNRRAQYFLAEMYLNGNGVPQEFAQAKLWYEKAAKTGLPEAQAALGGLYLLGLGTDRRRGHGYYWAIVSVIWSKDDIRRAGMGSLSEVSAMLKPEIKAGITEDAAAAWQR